MDWLYEVERELSSLAPAAAVSAVSLDTGVSALPRSLAAGAYDYLAICIETSVGYTKTHRRGKAGHCSHSFICGKAFVEVIKLVVLIPRATLRVAIRLAA